MSLINSQAKAWLEKVNRAAVTFERRQKNKILFDAAKVVVKAARLIAPVGKRVHYRYSGNTRIKYNPGNLKRSIKRLTLKRSQNVFVGPNFRKAKVLEYGGPGQPTDAYYASMIFGSAENFGRKVLAPAVAVSKGAVKGQVKTKSAKALRAEARRLGIKTN